MTTDWCDSGQHKDCPRTWQRWYIDPKTNKVVWLDEHLTCECKKRGCACYVPAKDRDKAKNSRRKS